MKALLPKTLAWPWADVAALGTDWFSEKPGLWEQLPPILTAKRQILANGGKTSRS
jgi:hypothetical protein